MKGMGFDTCTAPSLAAMKAWRPSFKVTNIYMGGAARGCAQPNLTERWVREVRAMGYRILPTYVGLQAPCGSRSQKFTARNAAAEGGKAAVDAARKARALGIPPGAPIYFDMEAYDSRKSACKAAVLRFVDNWVRGLKDEGYTPCLYSSAGSGVRDVGNATGIAKPEGIWYAHWDGKAQIYGDRYLPDSWWNPHRRIKQYRGDHSETHGGVTLNIDSDIADGLACWRSRIGPPSALSWGCSHAPGADRAAGASYLGSTLASARRFPRDDRGALTVPADRQPDGDHSWPAVPM